MTRDSQWWLLVIGQVSQHTISERRIYEHVQVAISILLQRYSQEMDGFLTSEFTTATRTIETMMTRTVNENTVIKTSFLRSGILGPLLEAVLALISARTEPSSITCRHQRSESSRKRSTPHKMSYLRLLPPQPEQPSTPPHHQTQFDRYHTDSDDLSGEQERHLY